jgi:hypothetical protein
MIGLQWVKKTLAKQAQKWVKMDQKWIPPKKIEVITLPIVTLSRLTSRHMLLQFQLYPYGIFKNL